MKRAINKILLTAAFCAGTCLQALASSHREAPLIAYDPQADNTDLYAFKSPTDSNKIIIIANYIPFQLPNGGPNWYQFGQNVRYEIHIKNQAANPGSDDITYRFTFQSINEDSTTFFNIRLGKQNLKTTYTCERSINGGAFTVIKTGGEVPPPNIGPRSIDGPVGMNAGSYDSLMRRAITTSSTGERLFAGPIDDPFFVDLGGAFDLGGFRQPGRDGLAKYNVSTIALEIPITTLQKNGLAVSAASNILDANFVIGVWASASRQQITTLSGTGGQPTTGGTWVQISRLGMPLTNEVIIPIGSKDRWNNGNPANDAQYIPFYNNPELGLYISNGTYGAAVPGLASLHIQQGSTPATGLGPFDFRNGKKGLYVLKGNSALVGTAFDPATYGGLLLPDSMSPRSVDIMPIFLTGVPNLAPYQLAIGKTGGNPLAAGKPFINNFLPTVGDMLRLNMAVPATPRTSAQFSSLGIIQAAAIALTTPAYANTSIQFIPNMDGFPNGRRLEDDVTTIELQAISGIALAAIGLPYDDYVPGSGNFLTTQLTNVLGFNAGVTKNDTTFKTSFPFVQQPWRGFNGPDYIAPPLAITELGLNTPAAAIAAFPNPFTTQLGFRYKLVAQGAVRINVIDINGRTIQSIDEGTKPAGEYVAQWGSTGVAVGNYFAQLTVNGHPVQTVKLVKTN